MEMFLILIKLFLKKKHIKEISQLIVVPLSIVALFGCVMILPLTVSYDTYRNVKCFFLINTKDSHLIAEIKDTNDKLINNIKKSNFIKNNINDFHNILN